MLSFFRKIRQNLLNEGKTAHYLKYAIGEVVLVVIGILIALQINDWRNDQRIKSDEAATLTKLIGDLKRDNKRFKKITEFYIEYEKKLLIEKEIIFKTSLSEEDIKVAMNFNGAQIFNLNPRTITYDEMLNSGRIYKISNQAVLNKIIEYYQLLEANIYSNKEDRKEYRALFYGPALTDYWFWKGSDQPIEYAAVFFQDQKSSAYRVLQQCAGWGVAINTQKLTKTRELLKLNVELLNTIQQTLNIQPNNND
jgi:hypothetical protein